MFLSVYREITEWRNCSFGFFVAFLVGFMMCVLPLLQEVSMKDKDEDQPPETVLKIASILFGLLSAIFLFMCLIFFCVTKPQANEILMVSHRPPNSKSQIPLINLNKDPLTVCSNACLNQEVSLMSSFVVKNEIQPIKHDLNVLGFPVTSSDRVKVDFHKSLLSEKTEHHNMWSSTTNNQHFRTKICRQARKNKKRALKTKVQQSPPLTPVPEEEEEPLSTPSTPGTDQLTTFKWFKNDITDKGELLVEESFYSTSKKNQPSSEEENVEDVVDEVSGASKNTKKRHQTHEEPTPKAENIFQFQNIFCSASKHAIKGLETSQAKNKYDTLLQFELLKQFEDEKRKGNISKDLKKREDSHAQVIKYRK